MPSCCRSDRASLSDRQKCARNEPGALCECALPSTIGKRAARTPRRQPLPTPDGRLTPGRPYQHFALTGGPNRMRQWAFTKVRSSAPTCSPYASRKSDPASGNSRGTRPANGPLVMASEAKPSGRANSGPDCFASSSQWRMPSSEADIASRLTPAAECSHASCVPHR